MRRIPRRDLLQFGAGAAVAAVCAGGGVGLASVRGTERRDELDALLDGTMAPLLAGLRRGRIELPDVAERIAARIEATQSLNAIVSFDRGILMAEAKRLAGARRRLREAPLFGLPVALKDNIDALPYATTAGTPALRSHHPARDAEVVQRLRAAGALIVGKTNMDELAAWGTTNNGVFGRTANPYSIERHTGGSSGGSAVAVAARLVPAALGTDTAGSIRNPASFCGVVGFRPTHDRVPARGVVPLARRRDSVGPFARSVADIVALDAVLAADGSPVAKARLRGLRLGVPQRPFQRDLAPSVAEVFGRSLETLQRAGVVLVPGEIAGLESAVEQAAVVTIGGAVRDDLQQYLVDSGSNVSVDDVFAQLWNPAVRAWLGEFFRPSPQTAVAFDRAWNDTVAGLRDRVRAHFASRQLDALVFPTTPIVAGVEVPGTGDLIHDGVRVPNGVWRNVQNNTPGSVWDGPCISLPAGLTAAGLPVGLELDGPLGADRRLLGVAVAVESALPPLPAPPLA